MIQIKGKPPGASDPRGMDTTPLPDWLDRDAYPFDPHTFDSADGRMRYLDEGDGPAVLLVHGTPTWSFLWRRLVPQLSRTHRVIVPDHLGFGLSDKPPDAPYRPQDHARRLAALVDALGLDDFALVVHDFGGPIGLPLALDRPESVRALGLHNTWLWSLADDPQTARASRFLGGPVGRLLYTRFNVSPRVLLPALFADRRRLDAVVHRSYLQPFPDAASRMAPWALAGALVGEGAWYEEQWGRVGRLAGTPALLAWGERDPAFGAEALARWRRALPDATVEAFPEAGHFVQEEAPAWAGRVADFLRVHHPPR